MRTFCVLQCAIGLWFARVQPVAGSEGAPTFLWAAQAGGADYEAGYSIAVDHDGNAIVAGAFSGTVACGETSLTSKGDRDIFFLKLDPAGKVIWARQAGGPGFDEALSVAVDVRGNVYMTGSFSGVAKFGDTELTSRGGQDVFLAKYDRDGKLVWAQRAGGTTDDRGTGVAADTSGNVYLTGVFTGAADLGGANAISRGGKDVFTIKFDPQGNLVWLRTDGGAADDFSKGIAVDASGYVFVTGGYQGVASFGIKTLYSRGGTDMFLLHYDNSGEFVWVKDAGSTGGEDYGNAVAVDGAGCSYVTGAFSGRAVFDADKYFLSEGRRDIFVVKFDPQGVILWARKAGGPLDDEGCALALDAESNVYVTGHFKGKASFDKTNLESSGTPYQDKDVFALKLDRDGKILWARRAGGSGTDYGFGIAVGQEGHVYLTGSFTGTAAFDSTQLTSRGLNDAFIGKLDANVRDSNQKPTDR